MKFLVVDDDPLTCDTVEAYLQRIGGADYCLKVNDGATALHLLATNTFDAVFLDLQLPGMDGESLLKAMPRATSVVVISASEEFGAASYAYDVVDYLVKPIDFERFARAVVKLKQGHARTAAAQEEKDAIFLKESNKIQRIDLDKLVYVEAQSNYASFVFKGGSSIMSLVSLRKLEKMLPEGFVRVHRSYIVNANAIRSVEGSRLDVGEKQRIPVGQSYKESLLNRLKVMN